MYSYRHTFLVITYNQREYVKEALDSILRASVLPYEVVIGDDGSSDGTVDILKEYAEEFPSIVRLILHKNNLGIFDNVNSITPLATGDVIHFLAGDDTYGADYLLNINSFLRREALNPLCEKFILLTDVIHKYPNGNSKVFRYKGRTLTGAQALHYAIRETFQYRLTSISRAAFNKWPNFPTDWRLIGPWVDRVQYFEFLGKVDKAIPAPILGNIYRVGVGIASKTKTKELQKSYLLSLKEIRKKILNIEIPASRADLDFINYEIALKTFVLNPSLWSLASLIFKLLKPALCTPSDLVPISRLLLRSLGVGKFIFRFRNLIGRV
jgi:glycosyltransferase involved in cell wall biosynthesis